MLSWYCSKPHVFILKNIKFLCGSHEAFINIIKKIKSTHWKNSEYIISTAIFNLKNLVFCLENNSIAEIVLSYTFFTLSLWNHVFPIKLVIFSCKKWNIYFTCIETEICHLQWKRTLKEIKILTHHIYGITKQTCNKNIL